jgi:microcin C transport system permease protein
MIERYLIKSELTLKRWRRFKKIRRAVMASWVFLFLIFLSMTAEFWANSKPLVMSYQGSIYFPVIANHHPSTFNQEGHVTNYRTLDWQDSQNWAVWPIIPWDPYEANRKVDTYPSPPSDENWLGTDDRGRDIFSRLIYGFRYSIGFSMLVWILTYSIGIFNGAVMGFAGGKVDLIGQRLVEIFEAIPFLLLLITVVSMFGASMTLLVIFVSLLGWTMISQYTRAEYLKLRKREFVESARAIGGSVWRQMFKHILPNSLVPVITFSPFQIASGISSLAILDYLGFGLPPPTPSWGELLQQAQKNFTIAWWLALFPSIALFISLMSLNLVGDGVRDAFDPKKNTK